MGRAELLGRAAVAAARAVGDPRTLCIALVRLGWNELFRSADAAMAHSEEALAVARAAGDRWAVAATLDSLGAVTHLLGQFAEARSLLEEALVLGREVGDGVLVAQTLEFLGVCCYFLGDLDRAADVLEESLILWQRLGDSTAAARLWRNLARVAIARGDGRQAQALLRRSLVPFRRVGWSGFVAFSLEGLAGAAAVMGQPARSLRLAGAASALREGTGTRVPLSEQPELDGWLALARRATTEDVATAAWEAGRRMTVDDAVAYALRDDAD
jgi:tetratricopeptide (TPR) repeat protein